MSTTTEKTDANSRIDQAHRDVKDLVGGALVNLVGKLGRLSKTSFAFVVMLVFGKEILGAYELVWGIVSTLSKIGLFGLHRGAMKFIVEARTAADADRERKAISVSLLLSTAVGLALVGLTLPAAEWILHIFFYGKPEHCGNPLLASTLRIMIWALPFINAAMVLIAATRALRIMRYDVYVSSIVGPLFLLLGALIAGFMDWGLEGLAMTQWLSSTGMCLLALYYFQQHFSLGASLRRLRERLPWKAMAGFSFPIMLGELLGTLLFRLDIFLITYFLGHESLEPVAIYSIVRRISSAIQKVAQSFDPIFSSIVSSLAYREHYQQMGARFASIARWSLTINLAFLGVLTLIGDRILALLESDSGAAIGTLVVFCLGMTLYGIFVSSEPLLIMSGRQNLSLINNVFWLLLNLALNYLLIPRYGILGAAIGTSLAMNLMNGVRMLQVYLIYGCHPFSKSLFKPLMAALGGFALSWWLCGHLPFAALATQVVSCICFLATYLCLLLVQGLEQEDRMLLHRLGNRLATLLRK